MTPIRAEGANRDTYMNFRRMPEGSNVLYRARNVIFGRDVVQKTVRVDAGSIAFQEPRLLKEFEHPQITPVLEAQFDPDHENLLTMIMPVFEGGSVAEALARDYRFSLHESMAITRDALDALEYTHARHNVAHRDVKPGNVLLNDARTRGFLSDFGSAAYLEEGDRKAPAVLSTPEYMAPECVVSNRHGPEADVFGVGMILFEMVNGRLRWEDIDRDRAESRVLSGRRALADAAYGPARFSPSVPPAIVRIVRKAIRSDPAARYASASEMVAALNMAVTIDWRHEEGDGMDGRWSGGWPPRSHVFDRDFYEVVSEVIQRGRESGQRRLVARYRRTGASDWRRFGVPDRVTDPADAEAVRRFFSDVAANAAHRRPAR